MAMSSFISSILLLSLICSLFPTNQASYSKSISKEDLGIKADDQQTHLTFYFHDTLSGSNPTSVQIAKGSGASNSPATFGSLSMIDDPLTEGPEASSKVVGRAQGMYGLADQDEAALIMITNFVFQEGNYNGSTLSMLGRNQVSESMREMPVVGGTGAFRFAKGYAQAKTQKLDAKTGDAVVQYDVFVSHASTGSDDNPSDGGSPGSSSGSGFPGSSKDGGSSSSASHTSLSKMVSFSFLVIPLLYLCIF